MKKIIKAVLGLSLNLGACTGIFLETENNTYTHARTLEFGRDLQSQILFVPRNYTFHALTPDNQKNGLRWQSLYATVGINAYNSPNFIDGVNEAGLAGGLFYFPGFAEYQDVQPEDYHQSLPMWQLLTWILTTFSTIEEVKEALPTILVSKAQLPGAGEVTPAHLIVHDILGKSIVVEYIKGNLHVHDNPLGVITNSPNFDWHMTNLRNYINLSPYNAQPQIVNGITLPQLGQGSGMLGLPGDFTPPSRFVRAVAFQQTAPKTRTELEAVYQAFHILHNFDIPQGAARSADGTFDYTQWTSATDMHNKIFYWRPYANFQLQRIELMKLNLNADKPIMFSMAHDDTIIERTVFINEPIKPEAVIQDVQGAVS